MSVVLGNVCYAYLNVIVCIIIVYSTTVCAHVTKEDCSSKQLYISQRDQGIIVVVVLVLYSTDMYVCNPERWPIVSLLVAYGPCKNTLLTKFLGGNCS